MPQMLPKAQCNQRTVTAWDEAPAVYDAYKDGMRKFAIRFCR